MNDLEVASDTSTSNFLRLYSDIDQKGELFSKRPLLAHYTSVSNLVSILDLKQIWFSNPLFLNDYEELRFGMNEAKDIFLYDNSSQELIRQSLSDAKHREKLHANFVYLFELFEQSHALDVFVLSFCDHEPRDNDGKLSMWRGYGSNGNGACIVFDSKKLSETEKSPLIFGKVHYATRNERLQKLVSYVKIICEELSKSEVNDMQLYDAAYYFFERVKLFALFSKHTGFEEEKEWRLVYMPERDTNNLLREFVDFHVTNTGVQPKLKFPIKPISGVTQDDLSFEEIVDRIILGPTISSHLSKSTFERLLVKKNLTRLVPKLRASKIPFRQL